MLLRMADRPLSSALSRLLPFVLIGALFPASACEPDEVRERPGRGLEGPNPAAVANLPSADEGQRARPPGRRPLGEAFGSPAPFPTDAPPSESSGEPSIENGVPQGPPRDLSAELHAALGQPVQCVAGAPDAATIDVRVSTVVDQGGSVLRATVSGGLSPGGLACMQARALSVRFRSPVPRAPITVSTVVSFRRTAEGVEATRTPVETPRELPPGAVDPMGGNAVPIAPRAGQAISAPAGRPVQAAPGTPVSNNQGVSIMGPTGTPIRR